jgi:hypothetical protein
MIHLPKKKKCLKGEVFENYTVIVIVSSLLKRCLTIQSLAVLSAVGGINVGHPVINNGISMLLNQSIVFIYFLISLTLSHFQFTNNL